MFTGLVVLAAAFVAHPRCAARPGHHRGAGSGRRHAARARCLFLLFLCNDRDVLGPWVNRPWFNLLASLILGVLLMLSVILVVSTIFPSLTSPVCS